MTCLHGPQVFLIIYTVCMMPVMVAFFSHGISEGWFIVNCIVDIIYIVDVVLNFRTGIVKFSAEGTAISTLFWTVSHAVIGPPHTRRAMWST